MSVGVRAPDSTGMGHADVVGEVLEGVVNRRQLHDHLWGLADPSLPRGGRLPHGFLLLLNGQQKFENAMSLSRGNTQMSENVLICSFRVRSVT